MIFETNKPSEAILRGKIEEARTLLAKGQTFSGTYFENNKSQIFCHVIRQRATDIVDIFIKNGAIQTDIYELETFERSFYESLAREIRNEVPLIDFLQSFLAKVDNKNDEVKGQTLLSFFMKIGADPAAVRCLIENGCNVHFKNNAEETLVHQVVSSGILRTEKGVPYLTLLLDAGVEADTKNLGGDTPLLKAVKNRQKEYLDILLQHGANPNEQDSEGYTAFYIAVVWLQDGDIYNKLKQYASPDFDRVSKRKTRLLPDYIKNMGTAEKSLQLLKQLLNDGADIYQTSEYYGTPKSGADELAEKSSEILRALLEAGVINVNRQDDNGNTLLHKVCAYDTLCEDERAREIYKKVKFLLAAGADVTITNDKDETAQMLAQQDDMKVKTVELLLKNKV